MIKTFEKNNKGFTLVELIVYMGIAVVLLTLIVTLYVSLTRARVKQQTIAEVENQGMQIMNTITQSIRNAADVNTPAVGATLSSLSLKPYLASTTNTVFDVASSTLRISEASSTPIALSNNLVVVSNLSFQNLSLSTALDSIKIQFTVSRATTTATNSRYEFGYSKVFYGSATMRKLQ